MRAVGWSQDGRFLYAGGNWAVNGTDQVRRWSDGGRGAYVDVPAASHAIFELIGLKSGSILIGSYLGLGFIDPDAKVTQLQGFGALDLTGRRRPLRVSSDGGIVQVDFAGASTRLPFRAR